MERYLNQVNFHSKIHMLSVLSSTTIEIGNLEKQVLIASAHTILYPSLYVSVVIYVKEIPRIFCNGKQKIYTNTYNMNH